MARRPVVADRGAASYRAGIAIGNDVVIIQGAGAPTSGASGTAVNYAGKGSLYSDRTNGKLYINTGTKASVTWTVVGSQS